MNKDSFISNIKKKYNIDLAHLDEECSEHAKNIKRPLVFTEQSVSGVINAFDKVLVEGFNVGRLRELYEALYSENERDAQYGKWQSIRLIKEILLKFCNGIGNTIDVEKLISPLYILHDYRIYFDHLLSMDKQESTKAHIVETLVFIMEVLYVRYRILISDDEVDIVEMLTGFFRSKGYEVFSAYNGVETLKLAELQPDIILLDINMPKLDGIEVCKKIRDYVSCPILFLTARIEENDKVQGFSVGGDDYIVKPFSLVELEARVQAHLRREERHQTNTKVKFSGELLIDYSERNVYIQNQPIGLVKKEFDIVELLSQNAGQVFDKERIYERVWGYDSEGDSSVVAEHIRRIRTKIAAYVFPLTFCSLFFFSTIRMMPTPNNTVLMSFTARCSVSWNRRIASKTLSTVLDLSIGTTLLTSPMDRALK